MDKAIEAMFEALHQENLLLFKATNVSDEIISEIDETWDRCLKIAKEYEDA